MSLIHIERTKLPANALNSAASSCYPPNVSLRQHGVRQRSIQLLATDKAAFDENIAYFVEDEPLAAMGLEMMVTGIILATVVVEASVAATKKVLHEALDFAFLDVDVTNGKTFDRTDSRLFLFRARRKNRCLLTCAAHRSFPSLLARLKLSACCRLS